MRLPLAWLVLCAAACAPKPTPPRAAAPGAVEFRLRAPEAMEVAVIGTFNDWDPAQGEMRNAGGVWTVSVALPPGRYRYAFWVDGAAQKPPHAPRYEDDEFGSTNGVLVVPGDL